MPALTSAKKQTRQRHRQVSDVNKISRFVKLTLKKTGREGNSEVCFARI